MKKNRLLLVLFILHSLFFNIVNGQSAKKYIKNCKPSEKEFYSKIPIKYINGLLLVEVEINEKKYPFLIDTGSPSAISIEIANELGLKTQHSDIMTDGAGIELKTDYSIIPSLKLGNITYNNVFASIDDFSEFRRGAFKCEPFSGIIGTDILKNGVCHLTTNYIILTNSIENINIPSKGSKLLLTKRYNPILKTILRFGMNEIHEEMLFDSGMNDFIHWQKNALDVVNSVFDEKPKIITGEGNSAMTWGNQNLITEQHQKAIVPAIDIGTMQLNNFSCFISNGEGSAVGARILETTELTIDWKNKRFYTKKINPSKINDLGFRFDHNGIITALWSNSPLLDYGIKLGDKITSVNGQNISEIKKCDFYKLRDSLKNQKLSLNFEGREDEITL